LPYQPDVVKAFQSSHSFSHSVFGLKDYAPWRLHNASLSRHSKLGGEAGFDVCNGFEKHDGMVW
jgi:hypothetical protein